MRFLNPTLRIPYLGLNDTGDTTRNWAVLKFIGDVDLRRIKREVRRWAKRDLDRTLDTDELRAVCVTRRIDIGVSDAPVSLLATREGKPEMLDAPAND